MAVMFLAVGAMAADTASSAPEGACAKGPVAEIPETVRSSTDEQTDITWYRAKSTSDRPDQDAFYLYAGKKGCEVWLRLRIQYLSEKPVAVVRLQVKADDKTFDLPDPHLKRDTDGKLTWQWFDEQVTPDHLVMLFTVTASKAAVVRFIGTSRTEERAIIEAEKEALKNILSAYHALGGKL